MIFFGRDYTYRSTYLSFCVFIAGAGGLLYIGATYIDCVIGHALGGKSCFSMDGDQRLRAIVPALKIAIPIYIIMVAVGVATWKTKLRPKTRKLE